MTIARIDVHAHYGHWPYGPTDHSLSALLDLVHGAQIAAAAGLAALQFFAQRTLTVDLVGIGRQLQTAVLRQTGNDQKTPPDIRFFDHREEKQRVVMQVRGTAEGAGDYLEQLLEVPGPGSLF